MAKLMILTALFLAQLLGDNAIFAQDYSDRTFQFSLYLDAAEKYQLFWKYNETDIIFKTKVKAKGYIGFGLSGNGGMRGADIVIGWVKGGKTYFKDRHAKGNMQPEVDPEQNWKLLLATEDQTTTSLVFTRPLRSCDTEHDLDIQRETQRVIWAYSANDPQSENSISYHGPTDRGSRSIYLMLDQPTKASLPSDIQHIDVRNPPVILPTADTTYWRTAYRLPDLDEKHHIIGMEPLINPQNRGIVHHILLYFCSSDEIDDSMHGKSWNIFQPAATMNSCESLMFGWGIGGGSYYLPDHVGFPIGGDFKVKFLMMETHYDNPQMKSDIMDNSGLRVFYTSELRPNDGGMTIVGMMVNKWHVIPPFADNFRSVGYCPGECTKRALSSKPEGIKFFAGILHSHLLGRKLRLRHIRNGTELPPILSDESFDFNFQESRSLLQEVTALPGDDFIMECDYSTEDRTAIAEGGLGTREEMCLAFMMYYPFVDFKHCETVPTIDQTLSFIDGITVRGRTITGPGNYVNRSMAEVLNTIDWKNKENRQKLESAVSKGRVNFYCVTKEDKLYGAMTAPEITTKYVEEMDFCRLGERLTIPAEQDTMPPQGYPYWAELENEKYHVSWKFDDSYITFHVVAKTTGWVGFGLSPNGEMENSDIVIGWVANDQVQFSDRFADSRSMPKIDKLQNWVILKGEEENGFTKLTFRRPLVTCDRFDRDIKEGNIHVIWAYDDQDPRDASSVRKHSVRGSKVLRLMNGPMTPSVDMDTMEDGTLQIEFRNPDVPITSTVSTYYNVGFKVPELKEKYHLIKVEPLIQAGNEDFIFHQAVFGCTDEDIPDVMHGREFDTNEGIVPEIFKCSILIATWTKGIKSFEYPSKFGFPIGGTSNSIKFIRLETLFSNPNGLTGLRDSTGLRLTLVPATRDHDVGFLRVGQSGDFGSTHIIAPGVQDFLLRGYCRADCLAQGLRGQPDGIEIVGVVLHSHQLATSIILRHIRKGQELAPILTENNFVFDNQELVMLRQPVQVKPGDEIVIDCNLDTTSTTDILTGGPQANNQPCLAILMYYPPINLGICESALPPTEIMDAFFEDFKFNGSAWDPIFVSPDELVGRSMTSILADKEASFLAKQEIAKESVKRAVQSAITGGATSSLCFRRDQQPEIFPNLPVRSPPRFTIRTEDSVCPKGVKEPRLTTLPARYRTTSRPTYNAPGGSINNKSSAAILCLLFLTIILLQ